ncbi:MAG: hypothetical protein EOP62_18200 [Sphingomonadales bacterium]|nr:MAG: hypothetical protein EOP62_18200 [Sphingomonadales bacterium]
MHLSVSLARRPRENGGPASSICSKTRKKRGPRFRGDDGYFSWSCAFLSTGALSSHAGPSMGPRCISMA